MSSTEIAKSLAAVISSDQSPCFKLLNPNYPCRTPVPTGHAVSIAGKMFDPDAAVTSGVASKL